MSISLLTALVLHRRTPPCAAALLLGCVGALCGPSPSNAEPESLGPHPLEMTSRLHLEVEYPSDGAVVPDPRGCGFYVAGWAGVTRFDVVFVIDTSESTRDPSGGDIDGDGRVGRARIDASGEFENSDPGDSILAAEVEAAREILQGLHSEHTRVAIVAFAGSPDRPLEWLFPRAPSAVTVQSLTFDHDAARAALDRMASQEPAGSTDIAAGVDRALAEFDAPEVIEAPGFARQRLMLFFTDGYPTLPFGPDAEAENIDAVLGAVERAREARARIHTFAIGAPALESPMAVIEMAERSGGSFTPVRHPADLVQTVRHAVLGEPDVELRNATTGEQAFPFVVAPDGGFHGFVGLADGPNRLEIRATSEGAPPQVETLDLVLDPDAAPSALPQHLVARRHALLEKCLEGLKRLTREAEREQAERLRLRLAAEIERERQRARERAEEQRKRLEIRAEDGQSHP